MHFTGLVRDAVRFGVVGAGITTLGYTSILGLTAIFNLDPYAANALVYAGGLLLSYQLHAGFVFKERKAHSPALRFIFSFVIAYMANLATLRMALTVLLLEVSAAQLLAIGMYSAVQFVLSRSYVFVRP